METNTKIIIATSVGFILGAGAMHLYMRSEKKEDKKSGFSNAQGRRYGKDNSIKDRNIHEYRD